MFIYIIFWSHLLSLQQSHWEVVRAGGVSCFIVEERESWCLVSITKSGRLQLRVTVFAKPLPQKPPSPVRVRVWTAELRGGSGLWRRWSRAPVRLTAAKSQRLGPRLGAGLHLCCCRVALMTLEGLCLKNPRGCRSWLCVRPVEGGGWSQLRNTQAVRKAPPVSHDSEEVVSFFLNEKSALGKANFSLRCSILETWWAFNTYLAELIYLPCSTSSVTRRRPRTRTRTANIRLLKHDLVRLGSRSPAGRCKEIPQNTVFTTRERSYWYYRAMAPKWWN